MTAYMIVFARIHDRKRFMTEYGIPTAKLIEAHGGEYVLRAPGVETFEGGQFDGMSAVISKWPDKASIERFWNSDDYRALKEARKSLADAYVMVAEAP